MAKDVVCVFVPESGEARLLTETWDRDVPFDRTEHLWLTDRRASEYELGLLSKHLSRRGFWGFGRWLRRHIDDMRKCEEERDPTLTHLMAYWTVVYDEEALRLTSKSRANRTLGALGFALMGDAYIVLNIEKRIGSASSHLVDMDLFPDPVASALAVVRDRANQMLQ